MDKLNFVDFCGVLHKILKMSIICIWMCITKLLDHIMKARSLDKSLLFDLIILEIF